MQKRQRLIKGFAESTSGEPRTPSLRAVSASPAGLNNFHLHPLVWGALAGSLGGFVIAELGLGSLLGNVQQAPIVAAGAVIGVALSKCCLNAVAATALASTLLYGLLAVTPAVAPLASEWVRTDAVPASLDAIVVLSSNVRSDTALDRQSLERMLTATDLRRDRPGVPLITTEVRARFATGEVTSLMDEQRLLSALHADSGWVSAGYVRTTHDEAIAVARLLHNSARIPRVALVTSPLHTRRACRTFEHAGMIVYCVPAREHELMTWHPLNSRDRLAVFRGLLYEVLGLAKYRAEGWL